VARTSSLTRSLGFVLKIVVPVAVLWFLLNFVYAPSCGRFSCSYTPSWWPVASADSGSCPESIRAAMGDADWAADRFGEIQGEQITTGLFYGEDGEKHTIKSGDERGEDAERARRVLRAVGAASAPDGSYPAASHVEVKVAALMREAGVRTGVMVINREGGPCAGAVGLSCGEVLPLMLPSGLTLRVWFPSGGRMEQKDFVGK